MRLLGVAARRDMDPLPVDHVVELGDIRERDWKVVADVAQKGGFADVDDRVAFDGARPLVPRGPCLFRLVQVEDYDLQPVVALLELPVVDPVRGLDRRVRLPFQEHLPRHHHLEVARRRLELDVLRPRLVWHLQVDERALIRLRPDVSRATPAVPAGVLLDGRHRSARNPVAGAKVVLGARPEQVRLLRNELLRSSGSRRSLTLPVVPQAPPSRPCLSPSVSAIPARLHLELILVVRVRQVLPDLELNLLRADLFRLDRLGRQRRLAQRSLYRTDALQDALQDGSEAPEERHHHRH
mmetsp:Transcript_17002/g.55627  ORF Transcript_17002/g.55627 Transcript_17002/m.55627 type:complete len:296 (+) Transcript_17002:69-956(+)|eukprot:CAMPEP_0170133410 /NCGR_PEP_ID=MMETSP0033_2-20121228/1276_1 /TAXON_ID=195969 /ORGANISM="Dolichomastix tenuilepis, Strain CCMP3274" /LENGTH=295 /DNA_ID=CAMNT_0010368891 /DNA_START=63 /DNA_END=950 /DNA_ORIENTATION=-